MHLKLLSYCCILLAISCNGNKKGETSALVTDKSPQTMQNLEGCYRMIIGNDTAFLSLTENAETYSGDLWYKRFEKDSNKGTIQLTKENDFLTGWYRFESEGTVSVRAIKFKIVNNNLAEGYGDVTIYSDTVKYKYPENLEYEMQNPFVKTNCNP